MTAFTASLAVIVAAFGGSGAVRIADNDQDNSFTPDLTEDSGDAACSAMIEAILPLITYREMFSPVVEGTYELKATDGSGYLGLVDGRLIVQNKTDGWFEADKFRWYAKERDTDDFQEDRILATANPGSLPLAFSLRNEDSSHYLTATPKAEITDDYKGQESQWFMQLAPHDFGFVYGLENRVHGWYGRDTNAQGEVFVTRESLTKEHGAWELTKVSGRSPLKWKHVKEMPVMSDKVTGLKWKHAFPQKKYEQVYEAEIERMQSMGRLDVDRDGESTDNTVRGVCDWDMASIRDFTQNEALLTDLVASLPACHDQSYFKLQHLVRLAFQAVCFDNCIEDLQKVFPECPRNLKQFRDFESAENFMTSLLSNSTACRAQPADNLEQLLEWVLKDRCQTWAPPRVLWTYKDHHVGYSDAFRQTTCSVYHAVATESKNSKDIVQVGTCPSGTACGCPQTWAFTVKSTPAYRGNVFATLFIPEGAAEGPSLLSSFGVKALTEAATKTILPGILAGTLTAGSLGPGVLLSSGVIVASVMSIGQQLLKDRGEWTCEQSVGCWPVLPEGNWKPWFKKGGHVCRMPEEAKTGGSAVWFLPPPGLVLARHGLFKRGCKLKACPVRDGPEAINQIVGFVGKTGEHVYNCQPLNFEDMTQTQRVKYVDALNATGVGEDYDLPTALYERTDPKLALLSAGSWGQNTE